MKSVWLIFYLLGNFVEIVLVSKNAPQGAHCAKQKMLLSQPAADCYITYCILVLLVIVIGNIYIEKCDFRNAETRTRE